MRVWPVFHSVGCLHALITQEWLNTQHCTLFLLCSDLGIYKSGDNLLNMCVKTCLRDLDLNCLPVNSVENIVRHHQFVKLRTVCY